MLLERKRNLPWHDLVYEDLLLVNEKAKVGSSSAKNNDNLHLNNTWDFPTIEWSFSDDEEDDMENDLSISSAPARFQYERAPRRGSLVRSISLVSSIMKEMKQRANDPSVIAKKRHKKAITVTHIKHRPKATSTHRLIALVHPTTSQGLQVGNHEGKFFL